LEDRRLLHAEELFSGPGHLGLGAHHRGYDHAHAHHAPVDLSSLRTRVQTHFINGVGHDFVWDPEPADAASDPVLAAATMSATLTPLDGIPALHSNPGATASLYLDFNGHFEATWGGYSNVTTPVYDKDGDATTFNEVELANIMTVWELVAEDFLPFNINVTTVEPPELAPGTPSDAANGVAHRVAIGPMDPDGSGPTTGGGVAYINSFTSSVANVCYVFATATSGVRWMGDTSSHEAGHAFGLQHQSTYDENGVKLLEYNSGNPSWGPLMGSSASSQISTWHNGTSSLGPTSYQDDIAQIARSTNVFGFRTDDHGNTIAAATPLAGGDAEWTGTGFVGVGGDVDWFSVDLAEPKSLRIAVGGPEQARNLDAVLELRDAAGVLIATANPGDAYDASLVRNLVGVHYVGVMSSGDYGRVGQYTVSVTESLPGVSVSTSKAPYTTSESGRSEVITLVLEAKPTADVIFNVVTSDASEGVPSTSAVVFTPDNWFTPQTVIVTGVADDLVDGAASYTVSISAAISDDPAYNGLFDPEDLTLVNLDDALGRLYWLRWLSTTHDARVQRSSLAGDDVQTLIDVPAVFGASGSSSYLPARVALDPVGGKVYWSDPGQKAIYRANLDGSDAEKIYTGVAAPSGLALDVAGGKMYWTDPTADKIQRANLDGSGVEDLIATGLNTPGEVELDLSAGKMYWTDSNAFTISRANLDGTDVQIVLPSDGRTRPGGLELDVAAGKMYFGLRDSQLTTHLFSADLDGVNLTQLVNISVLDPAFPTAFANSLTIDHVGRRMFWTDPNSKHLYSADLDGSKVATIIEGGLELFTGIAIIQGTPGFTITPMAGLETSEMGGTATLAVELNAPPTADVVISVSSSDPSEGVVSVPSLTFTPETWDSPQTITIAGANDGFGDGNIAYRVILGQAQSSDLAYHGLKPPDVSVTNIDNEIVTTTFSKTENAAIPDRGVFTSCMSVGASGLILDLDVRVNVTHSWDEDLDVTLIAPDGTRIELFTDVGGSADNFTNTILDDEATTLITSGTAPFIGRYKPEGNLTALEGKAATGTWKLELRDDERYDAGQLVDWSITVRAINGPLGPSVVVTPTTGLATTESGGTASFTVRLDSSPTANVVIPVTSTDETEGTVSVAGITFTPANWNVPQTVTITGVDDAVVDGNVVYAIVLGAASSADSDFNGLNPADVSVSNTDNDVPPTKFYVVDDSSANRTFEYDATGVAIENYALNSGNTAPRGAASSVAGDKTWVIDANRKVYVYDASGGLLGLWTAGSLASNATVEGIATNGTDVWIVDARNDRVYRYAGAAGKLSGSQNAASSFALNSGNRNPKDVVTDGVHLWVVNDNSIDKVFKYTVAGQLVGSWTIDSANKSPTGLTINPSNVSSIWIVDAGTDRVYQYNSAVGRVSGSQAAADSFALAAGNANPQGIADPPAPGDAALPIATSVAPLLNLNRLAGIDVAHSTPSAATLQRRRTSALSQEKGNMDFPRGDTLKSTLTALRDDAFAEPEETFSLKLSGASGADIAEAEGLGTIFDDDALAAAFAEMA